MKSGYTPYHPKWYRSRIPIFWWLRKPAYARFIVRELTSVPVAYAALLVLVEAGVVTRGPAAYAAFVTWLQQPMVVGLHVAVLVGAALHTITWLNLAPKALVVRAAGHRLPSAIVLAAHWAGWVAVTGLVGWLISRLP